VVDFKVGVADAFEVERTPLGDGAFFAIFGGLAAFFPLAMQAVISFAVAADEAAAVDLDFAVFFDKAELDGEPEETTEALDVMFVIAEHGGFAVGLQEVGEDAKGVQRDVAEDIVEYVGLGEVVHNFARADENGRGEFSLREAGEEALRGEVAWHPVAGPTALGLQKLVDAVELGAFGEFGAAGDFDIAVEREIIKQRHAVASQAEDAHAFDKLRRDLLLEHGPAAVEKVAPNVVIFARVAVVVLRDVELVGVDLIVRQIGRVVGEGLSDAGLIAVDDVVVSDVGAHVVVSGRNLKG